MDFIYQKPLSRQSYRNFHIFMSEKMFSYTFISALLHFVTELVISLSIYVARYLYCLTYLVHLRHQHGNGWVFCFTYSHIKQMVSKI